MKSKKSLIVLIVSVLIIVAAIAVIYNEKAANKGMYAVPASNNLAYDSSYQEYLDQNGYDGGIEDTELQVDLNNYTISDSMTIEKETNGLITGDSGSITWTFPVEREGFYNLEVGYIARPGTTSDIQRTILINGESCFDGAKQIVFPRYWSDEKIKDKNGNEIRPHTYEICKETKMFLEDYERRIGEPYLFYLKKGQNTITFEVIKEPIEYTSIIFKKAEKVDSYSNKIEKLKKNFNVYDGESIVYQAERTEGGTTKIVKNSTSINIQKNYSDSLLVPYHPYKIVYNTIGGTSWKQPGNAISWDITVPEEGLYELTFKGRQSLKRGVTSGRRLYINGEVPYSEMNAVNFEYSSGMVNYTIADKKGEPYLFYLNEGTNTITLECVTGNFGNVINQVEESLQSLNQIYLNVINITGQSPDKFIDYEIKKKLPEFSVTMEAESEKLFAVIDEIVAITGEKGENTSLLLKMAEEAKRLSKRPESVTNEIGQLKENISALATWLVNISEMPLELDSIILSGSKAELPRARNTFVEKIRYGTIRFASTFFTKTSQISGDSVDSDVKTIKVWMTNSGAANTQSIGKEQAQIVQNMIDEMFVPEYGINVDLQLIPEDAVLKSALAGNGPDVVLGLKQSTLQDFAMRNAVLELSQLEGFEEAISNYYDSVIDASSYLDGVYGMPQQADFFMLFYRKDILDKIGIEPPKTWDEVKEILPILAKYKYGFFLPTAQNAPNLYPSMVFQFGGDLYEGKGSDYGIRSKLYEDSSMQSFKLFTDFFTQYNLIVNADFPNRFREGQMPIGIIKYTTYCQLEVFAPEIKGLWSFAPIPGYKKQDGTINNSYVVETVDSVIMKSSKQQDDAWKFLQWWSSADTQLNYANTLESVMGASARYAAADPEVIKQLPWSNKELKQILAQYQNTIGIPAVPGNYMMTRMVQYAFNTVLAENTNPRETLYLNIKAIDKELTAKREEFGLSTVDEE